MMDEELLLAFTEMLKEKDARIKELTDLLLTHSGMLGTTYTVPDSTIDNPIPIGKSSNWNKRKQILEKRFSVVKSEELSGELSDEAV